MNPTERLVVEGILKKALGIWLVDVSSAFYKKLFEIKPQLKSILEIGEAKKLAKFSSMLSILLNMQYFDKKIPAYRALGERHHEYGAIKEDFGIAFDALIFALQKTFGKFSPEQQSAFDNVWKCLQKEMLGNVNDSADTSLPELQTGNSDEIHVDLDGLLDAIGGKDVILNVHKRFYDVIFEDKWLGKFFWGKDKQALITKQTQFMCECMGDGGRYSGDTPAMIHMHMYITDEQFTVRQKLLEQAILAEGISSELASKWLSLDAMFKKGIVKKSIDECTVKCQGQYPVESKKPVDYVV